MSSIGGAALEQFQVNGIRGLSRFVFGVCMFGIATGAIAEVKLSDFGTTSDGTPVQAFTITGSHGVKVELISRGATLVEWHVPDKKGKVDDVIFGFDDMAGYESKGNGYFGATVGRVANRIAGG